MVPDLLAAGTLSLGSYGRYPLNPTHRARQVVAFARAHGLASVVDATFATPFLLRALDLVRRAAL